MTTPFPRTTCACTECVACCKRQPGRSPRETLNASRPSSGETPKQAQDRFCASPGALVGMRVGTAIRTTRVGTITPKMENGRCVFLGEDDRCQIHPVAPAGCAIFDMHMTANEAGPRANWVVRQQMREDYQELRNRMEPKR